MVSATPGGLSRSSVRVCATNRVACSISASVAPGTVRRRLPPPVAVRIVDPVVEAAPTQRVVQVAAAVRRQHHHRRHRGGERAEFGHRHRRLTEEFEQQRLEFVVGAVDLIDEQHRRGRPAVADAAQDRPLGQELLGEQVRLAQPPPRDSASRIASSWRW